MKKLLIALLPGILFGCMLSAQSLTPQVVASAGNFVKTGNYSLSYTIGETVVPTFSVSGSILTQGFQQNELGFTGVQEISTEDVSIKVYPNPSADFVNVLVASDKNYTEMEIRLYDVLGRKINAAVIHRTNGNEHLFTISLTGLAEAMYFVTVYNSNLDTSHTFKINKNTP